MMYVVNKENEIMSKNTEGDLQKYIQRHCKHHCIACYKFASPARRGVPDLMLIYDGRVIFVELKSPAKTGRLSMLQKHELELLTIQGAECYVIDEYQQADEVLRIIRFDHDTGLDGEPLIRLRPYVSDR